MANELMETRVYLDFAPASIDFINYEELKKEVEKYADKYRGLVFTADEKQGAMQARGELKALFDAIEQQRKTVKNKYNKPLDKFEKQIKALTDVINQPLNDIREGLKTIEEGEKLARRSVLDKLISEKINEAGVEEFDENQFDVKWLNAGAFTAKGKPVKKTEDEIDFIIQNTLKEKERKALDEKVLRDYCEAQDIDASGWISQLEFRSASEIIDSIKQETDRKKAQEERMKAIKEQQEKQAQIFEQEEPQELQADRQEVVQEEKLTNTIRVTGTVSQLQELNEFLITSGIQVEEVEEDASINDLPF